MEKIKITKEAVKRDIENGFTRKELADKYGVPQTQITKLINHLGLKGFRAKKFMFEIVDDNYFDEEMPENYNTEDIPNDAYISTEKEGVYNVEEDVSFSEVQEVTQPEEASKREFNIIN